jgi:hypothetical protein
VWQLAQCDTTGLAQGTALSRCPPKNAKRLRPADCQAVATAIRHVSNFASETYYGMIDARPNIIIVGRVGIGFEPAVLYDACIKLAN